METTLASELHRPGILQDVSMIYRRHPLSASTTRVLHILPATSSGMSDTISCRLSVISIDPSPEYRALSYVWGDPSATKFILVDNTPFEVRENLWNYLAQARHEGYVDALWIDAICINQDDLDERSKQVAIMGQIYSKASEARVWLGVGTEDNLSAIQYILDTDWQAPLRRFRWIRGLANKRVESIRKLLELDYWSRVWIIQEYLLARCVAIQCGPKFVLGATLERMIEVLQYNSHSTHWPFAYKRDYKKKITRTTGFRIIVSRYLRIRVSDRPVFHFVSIMGQHQASQCSDLHDHVYALLSLDGEAFRTIVPDYRKPLPDLFDEVVGIIAANTLQYHGMEAHVFYQTVVSGLRTRLKLNDCTEVT